VLHAKRDVKCIFAALIDPASCEIHTQRMFTALIDPALCEIHTQCIFAALIDPVLRFRTHGASAALPSSQVLPTSFVVRVHCTCCESARSVRVVSA